MKRCQRLVLEEDPVIPRALSGHSSVWIFFFFPSGTPPMLQSVVEETMTKWRGPNADCMCARGSCDVCGECWVRVETLCGALCFECFLYSVGMCEARENRCIYHAVCCLSRVELLSVGHKRGMCGCTDEDRM